MKAYEGKKPNNNEYELDLWWGLSGLT